MMWQQYFMIHIFDARVIFMDMYADGRNFIKHNILFEPKLQTHINVIGEIKNTVPVPENPKHGVFRAPVQDNVLRNSFLTQSLQDRPIEDIYRLTQIL